LAGRALRRDAHVIGDVEILEQIFLRQRADARSAAGEIATLRRIVDAGEERVHSRRAPGQDRDRLRLLPRIGRQRSDDLFFFTPADAGVQRFFKRKNWTPRFRGGDEKKFGLIGHALPLRRPSLLLPGQEERDEESEVLSLARGAPFINRVPVASAPMIAGRIPTTAARRWL
jgi:hypothetical protein